LSLHREGIVEGLEVYVGAMSERLLRERMGTRDPKHSVLVVGDRHEIHRIAVEGKIRLLIVTGNQAIEGSLVEKARAVGTSIILTPFDSATTVRRLKFSA